MVQVGETQRMMPFLVYGSAFTTCERGVLEIHSDRSFTGVGGVLMFFS